MASKGLTYRMLKNDKVVITGIGECNDTNLIIPSEINGMQVVAINDCAFRYNNTITSIKIPNTVSHIGQCAFYECKKLKEIHIPENVYIVERYAFACCHKLENIVFGRIGQLDWFEKEYFHLCDKIKTIKIVR